MYLSPLRLTLTGLLVLLLPPAAFAQPAPAKDAPAPKPPVKTDRHGDPLPEGVTARLGTVRFRHSSAVQFLAFAPDGKKLVTSTGGGNFEVWEVPSGRLLRRVPGILYHISSSAAFSPDGTRLLVPSGDLKPRLWDIASGKELRQLPATAPGVALVAPAPDGKTVAFLHSDQSIWLGNLNGDKPPREFLGPVAAQRGKWRFPIGLLAFSPDGKLLACGGNQGQSPAVRLFELAQGRERSLPPLEGLPGGMAFLTFSPNGKILAVGNGQTLVLLETATGKEVRRLSAQGVGIFGVAFSPNGRQLALGKLTGVEVVDLATGEVRHLPDLHRSFPGVAFSPDGKLLAVGGSSQSVRLWEVATGKEVGPMAGHQGPIVALACSPDGKTVATGGGDHTVRLWEAATGRERRRLSRPGLKPEDGQRLGAPRVAFLRGGRAVAAAWGDGLICVWDTATGKELSRSGKPGQAAGVAAFSPDGESLALSRPDGSIELRPVIGEQPVRKIPSRSVVIPQGLGQPTLLTFTPDGRTLAAGHAGQRFVGPITSGSYQVSQPDRTVRLWEVAGGRLRGVLSLDPPSVQPFLYHGGHLGGFRPPMGGMGYRGFTIAMPITVLAFSPDGRTLVVSGNNGLRLWDVRKKRELRRLDPTVAGQGVAFSPDGQLLAVGGYGSLSLVKMSTGEPLCRLVDPGTQGSCLAFSPDGKFLVTAGIDTTALVWDVRQLLEQGRRQTAGTPSRLERLWTELAGADADKADEASWSLAEVSKVAVPFLAARLKAVPVVDPAKIEQLVKDLNHARYAVRQKSMHDLEALRDVAEPALRQALKGASLEVRRRVEGLLAKLGEADLPPERLRELRAVEALERAGTAEAVAVLRRLAGGAPEARLTREARGSLERLTGRKAAP
jgi:WD40 repeat protein